MALASCGGASPDALTRPDVLAGTLTVLAGHPGGRGSTDGVGAAVTFDDPRGTATDVDGNVYVSSGSTIRKITTDGRVTTIAGAWRTAGADDGPGVAARFLGAAGVAVDIAGNVYVADSNNHTIRKINPTGEVSTMAGTAGISGSADGTGATARFNMPYGIAVDGMGNVYVGDVGDHTIRRITASGTVTTFAGTPGIYGSADGPNASFESPLGLATDALGNVYVADAGSNTIRKITPGGLVSTLAGSPGTYGDADGMGSAASFRNPNHLAIDAAGTMYVTDAGSHTVRRITAAGLVTTLAGTANVLGSADGIGLAAKFFNPSGVALDGFGNVFVVDNGNNTIRKISPSAAVSTWAGTSTEYGSIDALGSAASFRAPTALATDDAGNVFVADGRNNTIRKITPRGLVSTIAGQVGVDGAADGNALSATFRTAFGIAVDRAGTVYVADTQNHTIRKISPAGQVSTLAGLGGVPGNADGSGSVARFNFPGGIAVDSLGNVFVADGSNFTIRKVTPAGEVTTIAGVAGISGHADGSAATFEYPYAIALDGMGNIYATDFYGQVRKIAPSGVVSTLVGSPVPWSTIEGLGPQARFSYPQSIATDASGNVYVADTGNSTIRRITPEGVVTTIIGRPGSALFLPGELPASIDHPMAIAISGTSIYMLVNNAVVVARWSP